MKAKELGRELNNLRQNNEAFKLFLEYLEDMCELSLSTFKLGNPRCSVPGDLEFNQGRYSAASEAINWIDEAIADGAKEIMEDLRQSQTDPHEVKLTDPTGQSEDR